MIFRTNVLPGRHSFEDRVCKTRLQTGYPVCQSRIGRKIQAEKYRQRNIGKEI
jgi:hypothetical protein